MKKNKKSFLKRFILLNPKKKFLIPVLFIFLSVPNHFYSQLGTPAKVWITRYNGTGNGTDIPTGIVVDTNTSSVIVTGYTYSGNTPKDDYVTIKYNSVGAQQWVTKYNSGTSHFDHSNAIAIHGSQNIYVTGYTSNGSDKDITTVKYDSSGSQQWATTYSGAANGDDIGNAIEVDANGDVYVVGTSLVTHGYITNNVNDDIILIKYNSSGAQQWVRTFDGDGHADDGGVALALLNTGTYAGVFVQGFADEGNSCDTVCAKCYQTLKYKFNGDFMWAGGYCSDGHKDAYSPDIKVTPDGFSWNTGYKFGAHSTPCYEGATMKWHYNEFDSGSVNYPNADLHCKTYVNYGVDSGDYLYSLVVDDASSPHVYVTGKSKNSSFYNDVVILKYDSLLNAPEDDPFNPDTIPIWNIRYSTSNSNNDANKMLLDTRDNNSNLRLFVAGSTDQNGTNKDFLLLQYDTAGSTLWDSPGIYNSGANGFDSITAIVLPKSGGGLLYTTGRSDSNSTSDIVTILWSQTFGSNKPNTISNLQPVNSHNYPNPFNPTTTISFNVPITVNVKLTIYNVLGEEVKILVDQSMTPGIHSEVWDASNFASGVYYYKLIVGNIVQTKKMLLLK